MSSGKDVELWKTGASTPPHQAHACGITAAAETVSYHDDHTISDVLHCRTHHRTYSPCFRDKGSNAGSTAKEESRRIHRAHKHLMETVRKPRQQRSKRTRNRGLPAVSKLICVHDDLIYAKNRSLGCKAA